MLTAKDRSSDSSCHQIRACNWLLFSYFATKGYVVDTQKTVSKRRLIWEPEHVFKRMCMKYAKCLFGHNFLRCLSQHTDWDQCRPYSESPERDLARSFMFTGWIRTTFQLTLMTSIRKERLDMGLDVRKPVFGVSDKVWFNPVCSATETSKKIESLLVASLDMILCNKRVTKALIRLRGWAGWSAPLLFAQKYSPDITTIIKLKWWLKSSATLSYSTFLAANSENFAQI